MNCAIENCTGSPRHMLTVARKAGFYCNEHAAELRKLRRNGVDLRDVHREGNGWRAVRGDA